MRRSVIGLFKRSLIKIGNILTPLISSKRAPVKFQKILIYLPKSLGIGDHIMFVPSIWNLARHFSGKEIYICSNWPAFLEIEGTTWLSHKEFFQFETQGCLLICPDYSPLNFRLLAKRAQKIGYILGTVVYSNFAGSGTSFSHQHGKYFDRFRIILDQLGVSNEPISTECFSIIEGDRSSVEIQQNFVCVSPFSRWPERQYDTQKLNYLLKILSRDQDCLRCGSEDERIGKQRVLILMG